MIPAMKLVREYLCHDLGMNVGIVGDFHIRCVCHVINRTVVDATEIIKDEIAKLRSLLKMIRGSGIMRQKFSDLSVVLSRASQQSVPQDVETRWNSMFLMIDDAFINRDILEALCNQADFTAKLGPMKLSDIDWRVLKSSKDFLESAYNCTKAASGRNYATLAMQPLIYTHLKNLCLSTISGATSTGFTTPTVKIAAAAMLEKLEKYCGNLTKIPPISHYFWIPQEAALAPLMRSKSWFGLFCLSNMITRLHRRTVATRTISICSTTLKPMKFLRTKLRNFP
jgi:hypothetical protein